MCLSVAVLHPELVLGEGTHRGLEWNIVSGPLGYRCGYIRVPKGHPWHGKKYGEIDCSVHGCLTFSDPDMPCHKGGLDDGYWVGFDCGHYGDAPDPELYKILDKDNPAKAESRTTWQKMMGKFPDPGEIRSQEYVEAECRHLIDQALEVA